MSMKRVIVSLAVVLVLFTAVLPSPASAGGCCWWPGAVVGGIVYGAVALATLPLWALSAAFVPPPGPYAPGYYGAPYGAPYGYYAGAPGYYGTPGYYAGPPAYYAPPAYSTPPLYSTPVQSAQAVGSQRVVAHTPSPGADVQREIVFPNGRYLLFGDGVTQPWQWAWEPAAASAPPSAATASATR
jgi:hypothetical protein